MASVLTVNVGELTQVRLGDDVAMTGIRKQPAEGRRWLRDDAVEGDRIGNPDSHGGRWKAVYAYAREDQDWWADQLDRPITNGTFGENLTTEGIDVTHAAIGERWQVGDAVLAVRSIRTPCWKWGCVMQDQALVRRFAKAHRPGVYLSIEVEGQVAPGDPIGVVDRPDPPFTPAMWSRALDGEEHLWPKLLQVEDLDPRWHAYASSLVV